MTESARPAWSLFIFCYNEVDTVGEVIDRCISASQQLAPNATEVLVIDDGSSDGSREIIESRCHSNKIVRLIVHEKNRGIGEALKTGYASAKGEFVCGIPADGQFDPQELVPFAQGGEQSVISFYRINKGYNLYRASLSLFNRISNWAFLGLKLRDVNWIKVYHRTDLEQINITINSSLVESEICGKLYALGCTFQEVPSIYHSRKGGETKGGSFKTVSLAMSDFFGLTLRVWRFRSGLSAKK